MPALNESHVEEAALSWFGELGYAVAHGPDLAPGELAAERDSFADVVLVRRLRDAITRLNPTIPDDAREEALRKVLRPDSPHSSPTTAPSTIGCAMFSAHLPEFRSRAPRIWIRAPRIRPPAPRI
jgi:type I site-specific restriction-modification system R (restriction) subunit